MNTEKREAFFSAKNVALLGILIALVIVLQLFASAIPMFGVTLNFSLIPIALAGILLGALGGTIVGFVCGFVVWITMAVLGQEFSTATMFQAQPVILTLMCIGKTTLAGLVGGLIFKPLSKRNLLVAVCVVALVIPVINTGVYMIGITLMKEVVAFQVLGLSSSSASLVFTAVFAIIWINFVLEMVINVIFIPLLHRVIRVIDKNFR